MNDKSPVAVLKLLFDINGRDYKEIVILMIYINFEENLL